MTRYKIVSSSNQYELAERVNEQMAAGWQPQGGVYFVRAGLSDLWVQAMVR